MARDIIKVQYPVLDHTESIANIGITAQTVTQANGITIEEAFSNKNNSLFVVIDNTADSSSALTVKAELESAVLSITTKSELFLL